MHSSLSILGGDNCSAGTNVDNADTAETTSWQPTHTQWTAALHFGKRWESVCCWGGNRYAGVGIGMLLGITLLDNRRVTKFPFHIFDRYEIHIQVLVTFI